MMESDQSQSGLGLIFNGRVGADLVYFKLVIGTQISQYSLRSISPV